MSVFEDWRAAAWAVCLAEEDGERRRKRLERREATAEREDDFVDVVEVVDVEEMPERWEGRGMSGERAVATSLRQMRMRFCLEGEI
mgnify:CR=1 FL=1